MRKNLNKNKNGNTQKNRKYSNYYKLYNIS